MIEGVNFIGYTPSKNGKDTFQVEDPEERTPLDVPFHTASEEDVDAAAAKAHEAFRTYRTVDGDNRGSFLEAIAAEIVDLGDELIERAMKESGLSKTRLEGERKRTCNQLRMFADLVRTGSWVNARIDTGDPDIRTMLYPIGPVAVFGASNFPLAFSTAGGDTASALAAGCPVIVKAHESHPGTNELVARAVLKAADKWEMPDGVFSSLNGGHETGAALVRHPKVKAVGFTGSFRGGKAISEIAQQRQEPIPVYAEMGSVNPVFLLEERLERDGIPLAEELSGSVCLGGGQFCTNPGILVGVKGKSLETFKEALAGHMREIPAACMLNEGIAENYRKKRVDLFAQPDVEILVNPEKEEGNAGSGALGRVPAESFMKNPALHEEVFGPFTLLVECDNRKEMASVMDALRGQLTVAFMGTENDFEKNRDLILEAREIAGRVIFNQVPTGVRVSPAMHHGGPWPATTDSKFTSVGTHAIRRFARPVALQNCPPDLLPDELKDENPLKIVRLINGQKSDKSGDDCKPQLK